MTCTHFFIDPIYFSDYIKLTFDAKAREIERKKKDPASDHFMRFLFDRNLS